MMELPFHKPMLPNFSEFPLRNIWPGLKISILLRTFPYHILTYLKCPTLLWPTIPWPTLNFNTTAILPCPALPCPALPYHTLTFPTISYPTLSYPALPNLPCPTVSTLSYHSLRRKKSLLAFLPFRQSIEIVHLRWRASPIQSPLFWRD